MLPAEAIISAVTITQERKTLMSDVVRLQILNVISGSSSFLVLSNVRPLLFTCCALTENLTSLPAWAADAALNWK